MVSTNAAHSVRPIVQHGFASRASDLSEQATALANFAMLLKSLRLKTRYPQGCPFVSDPRLKKILFYAIMTS